VGRAIAVITGISAIAKQAIAAGRSIIFWLCHTLVYFFITHACITLVSRECAIAHGINTCSIAACIKGTPQSISTIIIRYTRSAEVICLIAYCRSSAGITDADTYSGTIALIISRTE
jgi:hypothetical protein